MRYILDLYSSKMNEMKIHDSALFTLCQFANDKEVSVYQLFDILSFTKYKADYKNVHKKVKRFLNNGLIEKTKTIDRKHNSKFYRLTSLGIFTIFYHIHGRMTIFRSVMVNTIKGLLTNYGDDNFFSFFIYPFFKNSTIIKIESDMIVEFFINYCTQCAHKSMSILYEEKLVDENGKLASRTNIRTWLSEVRDEIKMDPPDNDSQLKKEYLKRVLNEITDNVLFDLGFNKITILENTMIFPIISQGKYKSHNTPGIEYSPWYYRNWKVMEKDINLLVKDANFYKMLETTKNGFDGCYKNIIEGIKS